MNENQNNKQEILFSETESEIFILVFKTYI